MLDTVSSGLLDPQGMLQRHKQTHRHHLIRHELDRSIAWREWLHLGAVTAFCLFLSCLVLPTSADALDIAILKSSDIAAYNQAVSGFKQTFPQGTTFTEYNVQGDVAQGRKLAQKIRASDADLVLAVGLKAALVAKLEILDVPVIFCMVLDPAKHGLKAPNMTGILLEVPIERQFATLRWVLPGVKRIGVLYDPDKTGPMIEDARRRAKGLGLELVARTVSSEKDVPPALRELMPQVDSLWLLPDSTVLTEDSLRFLLSTTLEASIPVIGFSPDLVKSGALIGLSVQYEDLGRQAGSLAKMILNNPNGSPIGITQPDRLRLSLNLKTAKFLGITVPQDVISRADEVY